VGVGGMLAAELAAGGCGHAGLGGVWNASVEDAWNISGLDNSRAMSGKRCMHGAYRMALHWRRMCRER
jgi:hypothetical protein